MKVLLAILLGGLVAGAFDITYAITYFGSMGVPPMRIFQSVASGWLGREAARAGGMDTAILGGITHFAFTTMMAAAYVFVSLVWRDLLRRPFQWGPLYGAGLYFLMNFIVIPHSAIGVLKLPAPDIYWSGFFVHMFLVGLPIALIARWYLLNRDEAKAVTA